jgi:hypothetical protein
MSRKDKLWKNLPQVPVIREHRNEFFQFMFERHMIWYRRFKLKKPPPWTTDKILRDYKFTNVYRELDRGTIWYMEHVVPAANSQLDLLWLTIMYRLLNRVETFEQTGWVNYSEWGKCRQAWFRELKILHEKESVFTSAHLTLPVGIGHQGMSKLDKYRQVLEYTHQNLKHIYGKLRKATQLKVVWDLLREIPCVGPFIAYEVCCDLILTETIPFTENDWANPGPGCKKGLRIIFPMLRSDKEFLDKMKHLQKTQQVYFMRLGLDFPYLYKNTPLTLRSIEHSLCEFQKYWQAKRGVGKHRMLFRPRDWPTYRADHRAIQMPLRFPR